MRSFFAHPLPLLLLSGLFLTSLTGQAAPAAGSPTAVAMTAVLVPAPAAPTTDSVQLAAARRLHYLADMLQLSPCQRRRLRLPTLRLARAVWAATHQDADFCLTPAETAAWLPYQAQLARVLRPSQFLALGRLQDGETPQPLRNLSTEQVTQRGRSRLSALSPAP